MGEPNKVKDSSNVHSNELRSSQGNRTGHDPMLADLMAIVAERDALRGQFEATVATATRLIAERDELREQNEQMLEILEDLTLGAYGQAEAKARTVLAKTK